MTLRLDSDDIAALLAQMDRITGQGGELRDYVDRWVCQTAGFRTSPGCVLRPLGDAMETVRDAFDRTAAGFLARWQGVGDQVRRTEQEFLAQDAEIRRALTALTGEVTSA